MNQVTALRTTEPVRPRDYSPQQLALIRNTVAADCNEDEFDLYIEVARRVGLDPFRRQIYAVVYNKDDAKKRKMSIITGIDGFRAVAARNRDYRPDDAEPQIEYDETLKGDENPLGIRKAVVKGYKLAADNQWHCIVGVAYWSEFAPIKEDAEGGYDWIDTGEKWADSGKPKKKKVARGEIHNVPAGKWLTMPHVMIAKCAEAQMLRKGWPEDLSGIYAAEEMDQAMIDVTPSEAAAGYDIDQRLQLVHAKNSVPILWKIGDQIELVTVGAMPDRCFEFFRASESAAELAHWRDTNSAGLREFWAFNKTDALAVKTALDKRIAELSK
jgi:phage recombination protein Bet